MSESTCHIGASILLTKPGAYADENSQGGEDPQKVGLARPQRALCVMPGSLDWDLSPAFFLGFVAIWSLN